MNRRDFIKTSAAVAVTGGCLGTQAAKSAPAAVSQSVSPAVGKPLAPWRSGELQFHFIYTGVGESIFIVYPDGTSMLLDCGDHDAINRGKLAVPVLPNGARHAGEWIARYVTRVNPHKDKVDYLVVSHFHDDHTGSHRWSIGQNADGVPLSGFSLAAETLHFVKAVDRGYPDYATPFPYHRGSIESSDHMKALYQSLQKRDGLVVERFRTGARDQFGPRYDPSLCADMGVFNLCANGEIAQADGTCVDLLADLKKQSQQPFNENGLSLGFIFSRGPFKLYSAGDFSAAVPRANGGHDQLENLAAPYLPACHVAKINHHGHHSMFPKLVQALQAQVWVACVWDQLHNTADTLTYLSDRANYAGDRVILPGIFPAERRLEDAQHPGLADIHPAAFKGVHVVVTVPPGGSSYTVTAVRAEDESMKVEAQFARKC